MGRQIRDLLLILGFIVLAISGCWQPRLPDSPPPLSAGVGENVVPAVLGGYSWTSKGRDQIWPPFIPRHPVFVEPDKEVTFRLGGSLEPESVRLEMHYLWSVREGRENSKVIASAEIAEFDTKNGAISFRWQVPDIDDSLTQYLLIVSVNWSEPETARATYSLSMAVANLDAVDAARKVASEYFRSALSGETEDLLSLVAPEERGRVGAVTDLYSPFGVALDGPLDYLTWKSDRYAFEIEGDPGVRLSSIGPGRDGPYSEFQIDYTVQVTDKTSGKTTRWDFTENGRLIKRDGAWFLSGIYRLGTPWMASGGKEKGYAVEAVKEENMVFTGKFSDINPYQGIHRAPDGRLAFVGMNFDRTEIWTINPDGTDLKRVFWCELDRSLQEAQQHLELLGWSQDAVRFILTGQQTTGPHAGKHGYWIAESDCSKPETRDIAFIESPYAWYARDLMVTQDGHRVYVRDGQRLCRIDMQSREVSVLTDDLPMTDGLGVIHYSPSGKYCAFDDHAQNVVSLIVCDLESGEKVEIGSQGVPEGYAAFFSGWGPDDVVVVSIASEGEVIHGENSSWPAGATSVRLYASNGELLREIQAPNASAGDRISNFKWSPDGSMAIFTVGPVVTVEDPGFWGSLPAQEAHSIWGWRPLQGESGDGSHEPKMLAPIQGVVEQVEWSSEGDGIEVWYRIPPDDQIVIQRGTAVSLPDGGTEDVRREIPWRTHGSEEKVGVFQGYTYYRTIYSDVSQITRRGPDGKTEVLYSTQSPVDFVKLLGDILVFTVRENQMPSACYLGIISLPD